MWAQPHASHCSVACAYNNTWYLVAAHKILVEQMNIFFLGRLLFQEFLGSCFFLISPHALTPIQL